LITNSVMARRFVAGEIGTADLHEDLTDTDSETLKQLLSTQSARVLTVAEMLCGRRRRRVVGALRATVQMSGERFEALWREYLRSGAPRGVSAFPTESSAFGNWLLPRLEPQSLHAQLLTYELRRSEIGVRLQARDAGEADAGAAVLTERTVLRLSRCVCLERFDLAVDEIMVRFRRTGEIVANSAGGPVHLVFHPVSGRYTTVGVTKVSATMSSVLERSAMGSALHELLSPVPAQMHAHVRSALEKLVAIRVLDIIG